METNDPIADFLAWFRTRPIVTKTFMTTSFIIAILNSLGYFSIYDVYYTYQEGIQNGQWWRIFASLVYLRNFGFVFLAKSYMAYLVLYYAERDIFERKNLADFLMLFLFSSIFNVLLASFVDIYFVVDPLLFSILVVEARFKQFQKFKIIFNSFVPVKYFIFVYLGFNVLMGEPIISFVFGFAVGYLYILIKTRIKNKIKIDLWPTPSLLKTLVKKYLDWSDRQPVCYVEQEPQDAWTEKAKQKWGESQERQEEEQENLRKNQGMQRQQEEEEWS